MPKRKKADVALPEGLSLAASLVASFGDEDVVLGDGELDSTIINYISTGVPSLDYAIGQPGVPIGRLSVFMGKEGSAKSTVAQHLIVECQRMGGISILVDAERTFSQDRAVRIGINLQELVVNKSLSVEKAFEFIDRTIKKIRAADADVPVLILVDSLAALPAAKVLEEDSNKSQPALVAKFISQEFPILIPRLARANVALIIVNQLRNYIEMNTMRAPERRKTMGERTAMIAETSLIFYASLILHFTSTGFVGEDKKDPDGISVRVTIRKEKFGPGEGRQAEFDVLKDSGVDVVNNKFDLLVLLKVIKLAGSWYDYPPFGKKFHRDDFPEVLAACPELEDIVKRAPTMYIKGETIEESLSQPSDDSDDEED